MGGEETEKVKGAKVERCLNNNAVHPHLRRMKKPLAILLTCTALIAQAQTTIDSLLIDGIYRTFRVHVPPGFSTTEHLPLVLNLHGYTSNAVQQEAYSEMNAVADVERFVVVYPDGVNNSWNLGLGTVDEYSFFTGMIDLLEGTHNINTDRVYSCGMSQGGYMSFVLACSMYDRIAAIASVAGSMAPGLNAVCAPTRPVPVMMIHGTADGIVPYTGGLQNDAIPDVIDFWVQYNNCDITPVITPIPDIAPLDLCTADRQDHNNGDNNSQVALITINAGGHTWPGASITIGVTNQDFEASQVIWDFFDQYDINGALSATEVGVASEDFVLLPTLFGDHVELRNNSNEDAEVKVMDAIGRSILRARIPAHSGMNFSGSNWQAGTYFWRMTTARGHVILKSVHRN